MKGKESCLQFTLHHTTITLPHTSPSDKAKQRKYKSSFHHTHCTLPHTSPSGASVEGSYSNSWPLCLPSTSPELMVHQHTWGGDERKGGKR
jgi:hypothetical protein